MEWPLLNSLNTIGWDTETFLIENGKKAPPVVCLTYYQGNEAELVAGPEVEEVMHTFLSSDALLVGQNSAFDAACLCATFPSLIEPIWKAYDDTRMVDITIGERLIDFSRGIGMRPKGWYGLDKIALRHTDLVLDKENPWRIRFGELADVPLDKWPDEAVDYALDDAVVPELVWKSLVEQAHTLNYHHFEVEARRQTTFDFPLYLMQTWGVRTNPDRVRELSRTTRARIAELKVKLQKAGLVDAAGKKVMSAIRDRIAELIPQPPLTKTGLIKTDKYTLEKCHDDTIDEIQQLTALTKLDSTYIKKLWEGVNGNLHARFHVLGARTGRTSSSGPNLQNQPREGGARECFEARAGYVFILCDYDSQELRTLAQACLLIVGWSKLAEKYQEDPDFDPHTDFASAVMGWDYHEALARKARGDKEVKERRQQAKAGNFGFPGGMGARGFVGYARGYGVKITEADAEQLRNKWFDQWPEVRRYFRHVQATVQDGGTLEHLKSKRLRGNVGFCDGANSYFQGLASEASKTAGFLISRECYSVPDSPLFDCRPVMLVHDELIIEAPEGRAHEAATRVQELMVQAMHKWCPDVPSRATPSLCRYWTKAAEPVYVDGRLVPWESSDEPKPPNPRPPPRRPQQGNGVRAVGSHSPITDFIGRQGRDDSQLDARAR